MSCPRRIAVVCALAVLGGSSGAFGWGLRTHRWINEHAIATVPEPLRSFLARHREELSDLAVEPDVRLRAERGQAEAVRHYIDLDLYGEPPFRELPRSRRAAVAKFGSATVSHRGLLLWVLTEEHDRLAKELRAGRWQAALRTAGLAGHYVADAFMPLHTTANHDGQRTGNRGIHRAIERELIDERFARWDSSLDGRVRAAPSIRFDAGRAFAILLDSYSHVPSLMAAETRARRTAMPGTPRYLDVLEHDVGERLSDRIAGAATELGSFWLSAWSEAGRPPPRDVEEPHRPHRRRRSH